MERKNEKEFYLFADNAYNEEKPKIYAENGRTDGRGFRLSGATRGVMNIFEGLSSATQTPVHVPRLPSSSGGGHSVAQGSRVWRQVSRPRVSSQRYNHNGFTSPPRSLAGKIPLRFPEGSIAP